MSYLGQVRTSPRHHQPERGLPLHICRPCGFASPIPGASQLFLFASSSQDSLGLPVILWPIAINVFTYDSQPLLGSLWPYHLSLFVLKKSETLLIFNWVRSDSYGEFSSGLMWYTHLTVALSLRNCFLMVVAALLALVVWIWFKRSLDPTLFLVDQTWTVVALD